MRHTNGCGRRGVASRVAVSLFTVLLLGSQLPSSYAAVNLGAGGKPPRGTLSIRLAGLPRGERGSFTLLGPPQYPSDGKKLRRRLSVGAAATLRLRPGVYEVKVAPVTLRHSDGRIRHGARALPSRRVLRVRVRLHRQAKVTVRYGTIINPGVRSVNGAVSKVLGDPKSPNGVILRGAVRVHAGNILSAQPSVILPNGLLARAISVRHRNGARLVELKPVSIYDVAPNMSFDIPLSSDKGARLSRLLQCSVGELGPYAKVGDLHLTGGWTTSHVLFVDVTTGAYVELHYRVSAGLHLTVRDGVSCSVPLPVVGFQGMAGPIPVYGGFRPMASAELGAAASFHAGGSVEVTTGARIGGVPPSASPIVRFSSPRFEFVADLFAGVKASIGLDAELGIGVEDAASIHADLGNSLDFTASPGQCSWDLNLGTFSATGELGPFSISTPSTPALYHHNLWHASCGPSPSPPPLPPPQTSLPLIRATMSWDTDSDIDLYSWDEAGDLAFWEERYGVPDAELVEDIIPSEGEFEHGSENFQETSNPNRRYTFGICDYRGEGANVTLTLHDPGGATRTFHHTLTEVGDSAVIATSPEGTGYSPPPGWCRNIGSFEEEFFEE
jgi:hypothetical protein